MAKIGLKYLVAAALTDGTTPSYANGIVVAKSIKADLSINLNEAMLYADDALAESVRDFKDGKITFNINDLESSVQAWLFGHTTETLGGGETLVKAKDVDDGPYVGVGFYSRVVRSGVTKYRAIWLKKVKFAVTPESWETKGETTNFQPITIEGSVYPAGDTYWKYDVVFNTEADAINWLDLQCVLTGRVEEVVADPAGGVYTETQSVSLSCGTAGATIKYSLDGSDPSLTYSTPLSISATSILKTKATKSGMTDSVINTEMYWINL